MLTVYVRSPVTAQSSIWHQKTQSASWEKQPPHSRLDYGHVTQKVTISMLTSWYSNFREYSQMQCVEVQLSADTKINLMGLHNPVIPKWWKTADRQAGRYSACWLDYLSATYWLNNCLNSYLLQTKKKKKKKGVSQFGNSLPMHGSRSLLSTNADLWMQ